MQANLSNWAVGVVQARKQITSVTFWPFAWAGNVLFVLDVNFKFLLWQSCNLKTVLNINLTRTSLLQMVVHRCRLGWCYLQMNLQTSCPLGYTELPSCRSRGCRWCTSLASSPTASGWSCRSGCWNRLTCRAPRASVRSCCRGKESLFWLEGARHDILMSVTVVWSHIFCWHRLTCRALRASMHTRYRGEKVCTQTGGSKSRLYLCQ